MDPGFAILLGIGTFALLFGVGSALSENVFTRYSLRRDRAFKRGFLEGRHWLAAFIADAEVARDRRLSIYLSTKPHPARKAAELVTQIKDEKRQLVEKLKFLEYQVRTYEEYFPQLEEFRELILDERIPLSKEEDNFAALEATDPVEKYLPRNDWKRLSISKRNQKALDLYVERSKPNWQIGRYYERYLGYLRETAGWAVTFHGALHGLEDLGRDLICEKAGVVEIVQAKCWSATKVLHEKHLFQLFGTTVTFRLDHPNVTVTPVLATTTKLSDVAREVARLLDIRVDNIPCPPLYPMIKCNINPSNGERIYHLPFDQQYDRVKIATQGEFYASSVREAEKKGFRRAWKHRPT